jgi:hypothetical protein
MAEHYPATYDAATQRAVAAMPANAFPLYQIIYDSGGANLGNQYTDFGAAVDACNAIDGPVELFMRTDAPGQNNWTRSLNDIHLVGDRSDASPAPKGIEFTGACASTSWPASTRWIEMDHNGSNPYMFTPISGTVFTAHEFSWFRASSGNPLLYTPVLGFMALLCNANTQFYGNSLKVVGNGTVVELFLTELGGLSDDAIIPNTGGLPVVNVTSLGASEIGTQTDFAASGGTVNVTSLGSPHVTQLSDVGPTLVPLGQRVVACDPSGNAVGVELPDSTYNGALAWYALVYDSTGDAATNNITITVENAGTINGTASKVISTARGAVLLVKTDSGTGDDWAIAAEYPPGGAVAVDTPTVLTSAANVVAWDAVNAPNFKINALPESTEMQIPSNAVEGDQYILSIEIDGTGGRVVTWAAGFINVGQLEVADDADAISVVSVIARDFGSGLEFAYAVSHAETITGLIDVTGDDVTVDATPITLATLATGANSTLYLLDLSFVAKDITAEETLEQGLRARFYRDSVGVVTKISEVFYSNERDDVTWTGSVAVSGTNIVVQFQGDATNNTTVAVKGIAHEL